MTLPKVRVLSLGCTIAMADGGAAGVVRKIHTQNPAAFSSWPMGSLAEGVPRIGVRLPEISRLPIPEDPPVDPVALITLSLGGDDRLLRAVAESGHAGLAVEALGGGHASPGVLDALSSLARRMPVVLASRTGGGEVLQRTYGFPGSETDLIERGLIPEGPLDGPKARLLLTLTMASASEPAEIAPAFEWWIRSMYG